MHRDELITKMAMELEEWPDHVTRLTTLEEEKTIRERGYVWVRLDMAQGSVVCAKTEYGPLTKTQWLQRRAELINKPSWDDAPERAEWLAQNASGRWMWYGDEPFPVYDAEEWHPESGKFYTSSIGFTPAGHDWRDTLEPRPQPQSDIKTCRHCDIEFRRPHVDGIPDDRCTRCDDEIKALWPEHEPVKSRWTSKTCTQCGHTTAAKVSDDNPVCPGCVAMGPDISGGGLDVSDPVNHPAHYQSDNGIECIDAIRAALGKEGFIAYCRGNAIKYAWRSDRKGKAAEDKRKAAWYLERAAKELEE